MPHSPDDKKRALARLHRIRGQAEALERAIEAGAECRLLLQQIAALRGAAGGLMAEVLESHLRDTFGQEAPGQEARGQEARGQEAPGQDARGHEAEAPSGESGPAPSADDFEEISKILRTYLK